ncbi:MAG: hypothetical protein KF832_20915 [Caldilineaceae bacterium]|nr:hypothetical protein [Caldilineaceae bacterium]
MQTPMLETAAWQNRWDALQETIVHTGRAIRRQAKSARQSTIEGTLLALEAFGSSQMAFFGQGFRKDATVLLEPSTQYPPEYAFRATIDQLAQDLDMISRAWQQRLPDLASPKMIATLNKADTLAYQALEPAIRHQLVPNATVVTYFQKETAVRLIPYAPVILIGLPLTILTSPQDLLAVPHEVGHYLYQYGRVPPGSKFAGSRFAAALNYRFADQPAWLLAWMEEIVADIYGAIIGGPAMTLGFEALITDDPRAEFTHDDGVHPIAALRPAIYHTVLKELGGFERVRTALIARWESWQAERGNPRTFITADQQIVALRDAKALVDHLIADLLRHELAGIHVTQPWSSELAEGKELKTLSAQFADYVNALPTEKAVDVPDLQIAEESDGIWLRLKAAELPTVERKAGATGLWIDAIKDAAQRQQPFNMPPHVWMTLLDESGWATEGPGGGVAH